MPIVQAGKQFTAADIKDAAGKLATWLQNSLTDSSEFHVQLESWPDADLVELGLTQEEINAIKGFFVGDLPAMTTAFQNSAWVKQLLGTSV